MTEYFKTMIHRGPRPDPEKSAAEYWRHKRAVLAIELMDPPVAEESLEELAGLEEHTVAREDAKASLARLRMRKAAK